MTLTVKIYPEGHVQPEAPAIFYEVDRVSFVNHDSYGPSDKIGGITAEDVDTKVLVINTNNIMAVEVLA